MNMKYKFIIVIFLTVLITWKTLQYYGIYSEYNDKQIHVRGQIFEKLKVTVYYESLCSDSRNFIIKQLLPTYNILSNYMILDLVPYGKAKTIEVDGNIQFQCQHTATECLGNKIHACAIDQIADPMELLKYVACMIDDGLNPYEVAEQCSHQVQLDYDILMICTKGEKASRLLKEYGIQTDQVYPAITFIPTIELNGSQKVPLPQILKNFKSVVCNSFLHMPTKCL